MRPLFKKRDLLAAGMVIPFLNFARGLVEIDAWPVVAAGLAGIACLAIALLFRMRRLLVLHYAIGSFFLFWIVFPSNAFTFRGPDFWTYRHFADRKFTALEEGFLLRTSSEAAAAELVRIATSSPSLSVRLEAVHTLGRLGDRLRIDDHATEALELYRRVAIPCLGRALNDESGFVRRHAALVLQCQGEAAAPVVSDLRGRLNECDDTALFSAEALGDIGPAADAALPELLRALEAGCSMLRFRAAEALGRIGSGAAVEAALEAAMRDTDERLAEAAAAALQDLSARAAGREPSSRFQCRRYTEAAAQRDGLDRASRLRD